MAASRSAGEMIPASASSRRCARRLAREQRAELREVAPVPHVHAVGDPVHLAEAGARRERHGVDVVEHQCAAHRGGVLAIEIGPHRRRAHLPQLLACRAGAAFRRVTVFLDLRCQRAAAGRLVLRIVQRDDLVERRAPEAVPLDGGIAAGVAGIEQLAVLDEQQRLHQQRGDVLEARVAALGKARAEQRLAAAVGDLQPGARLGPVGKVQAAFRDGNHVGRETRLDVDGVSAGLQTLDELRQPRVAHAIVVGRGRRKPHRGARPGLHAEREAPAEVGQQMRLQA